MSPRKTESLNISSYKNFTPILKMTKPKSPLSIWFLLEDPSDDWLIHVVTFKTKSGEISHECMIIKPDFESRIASEKKDGYLTSA